MSPGRFWLRHAAVPAALFLILAPLFAFSSLDATLAAQLFFDAESQRWIGAGSWWTNDFSHEGGRLLILGIAAAALLALAWSCLSPAKTTWRRPASYAVLALGLSTGLVGLLKAHTNIACPWDLAQFGGTRPYVHLFSMRPADLPQASCFPAAHAASGYALLCFYFLARERSLLLARGLLAVALLIGLIFGLAQQSRGAHFLSHDLWSAVLAWFVCLSLYAGIYRARLWGPATGVQRLQDGRLISAANGVSPGGAR